LDYSNNQEVSMIRLARLLCVVLSLLVRQPPSALASGRPPCPSETAVVLLGTAGGAPLWPEARHRDGGGVSSALVVGDSTYVVDAGEGAALKYRQAGLGPAGVFSGLERLRSIFITHMHDDHVVGLPGFLVLGLSNGLENRPPGQPVIPIIGPANAGGPPFGPPTTPLIEPTNPMPGITETSALLISAFRTPLNSLIRSTGRPDPRAVYQPRDLSPPVGSPTDPTPSMAPFEVYRDEKVVVTAVLVRHSWPSYAFRFDTAAGAVVFSGDTGPETNGNIGRLAAGADILVHEVFHPKLFEQVFGPPPFPPEAQSLIFAFNNFHTSADRVGEIAKAANVGTLVLNHLVPGDIPNALFRGPAQEDFSGRVIVGEDLMRLCVGVP
jgi:ribonuclease BN (tRNA processing enzyme)